MSFETEEQRAEIVARVWEDPEFKQRLKDSPKSALAEMGVHVPDAVDLKVVESTPQEGYFVLPPEPSTDLTEDELDMVAGGMGCPCCAPCDSNTKVVGRLREAATLRLGSEDLANSFLNKPQLPTNFKG